MSDQLLDHLRRALGDSFLIERELSGAGMSRVFVARERALGREVVIKVLPKELALGVNRERFQQEVQLAAKLTHPYIVNLLHAGEHEDLLWFTMPFIQGESLKDRLERTGKLSIREVIQYSRDVAEALAYAHSQGVIHRDIKPANILVDGGHGRVTDFGVAKALSASLATATERGHTTTGMAIGTPAYMAPEQLAADPEADQRVDIYAMGLLMYELLSGSSPFATPSPTAMMAAQLTRMPTPIEKVRPDVPASLAALVTRCLAKSPDDRPSSAEDIVRQLDQVSNELVAEESRSSASRMMQRLLPAMLGLVLLTTVGVAAMIYRNSHPATPLGIHAPPNISSDSPDAVFLSPGDLQPKTREDSLRRVRALKAELERLDPEQSENNTTISSPDPAQMARLDSLVNAAVDARLKESARAAGANAGASRGRSSGRAGDRGAFPALSPRRVVIETGVFIPRGSTTADSGLTTLSNALGQYLVSRLGRGWEAILREQVGPGFRGGPPDTAIANADAIVSITLTPHRSHPDSVSLRIMVTNLNGVDRRSQVLPTQRLYKPVSPEQFDETITLARGYLSLIERGTWPVSTGNGGRGDLELPGQGFNPAVRSMRGPPPGFMFDSGRRGGIGRGGGRGSDSADHAAGLDSGITLRR